MRRGRKRYGDEVKVFATIYVSELRDVASAPVGVYPPEGECLPLCCLPPPQFTCIRQFTCMSQSHSFSASTIPRRLVSYTNLNAIKLVIVC